MDRTLKEKRDQLHLEKKLQEEDESLESCTFRPEIGSGVRPAGDVQVRQSGDIYERNMQWKQSKEERYSPLLLPCCSLREKKESLNQDEEQSCVFVPAINPAIATPSAITTKAKGVDKFIDRQRIALEARQEKELLMRRDIGLNWVRKTTIPSEFRLLTSVFPLLPHTFVGREAKTRNTNDGASKEFTPEEGSGN